MRDWNRAAIQEQENRQMTITAGSDKPRRLSVIGIYRAWPGRNRRGLVISILALLIVGPTLVLPLYWGYAFNIPLRIRR